MALKSTPLSIVSLRGLARYQHSQSNLLIEYILRVRRPPLLPVQSTNDTVEIPMPDTQRRNTTAAPPPAYGAHTASPLVALSTTSHGLPQTFNQGEGLSTGARPPAYSASNANTVPVAMLQKPEDLWASGSFRSGGGSGDPDWIRPPGGAPSSAVPGLPSDALAQDGHDRPQIQSALMEG